MATARDGDGRASPAKTESSARLAKPGQAPVAATISLSDRQLVKESFGRLMATQQFAMEYLYARLFVQHPQFRALFPFSMEHTRTTTFEMLGKLVASLDSPEQTDLLLSRLGRDHRKFGVKGHHYGPFFDVLRATVEQVSGRSWAAGLDAAWTNVLRYFSDAMKAAAQADARDQPAWWIGEIVQHDRRTPTIAVLTIRPERPLKYEPGQYITAQVPKWPRLWRRYSIANAPRENGLLDLHVRAVPGGMVSTALVSHCGTGDILTLAAASGDLRIPADPERDLVCVAGGTGLAPIKSIVESVVGESRQGKRREITMYVGARRTSDLYDMRDLATLRLAYPALTLIPVVEDELEYPSQVSRLPEVVNSHASFRNTEVYLAGPASMISATRRTLSARVPSDRFRHDPLDVLVAASRPIAILRSASDHPRG